MPGQPVTATVDASLSLSQPVHTSISADSCFDTRRSITEQSAEAAAHHHHHHVTQSSHSINAIGPAPLWSGRKREHCSISSSTSLCTCWLTSSPALGPLAGLLSHHKQAEAPSPAAAHSCPIDGYLHSKQQPSSPPMSALLQLPPPGCPAAALGHAGQGLPTHPKPLHA
jgi:hypothetical protein